MLLLITTHLIGWLLTLTFLCYKHKEKVDIKSFITMMFMSHLWVLIWFGGIGSSIFNYIETSNATLRDRLDENNRHNKQISKSS